MTHLLIVRIYKTRFTMLNFKMKLTMCIKFKKSEVISTDMVLHDKIFTFLMNQLSACSMHEMGMYDVPAEIEYALKTTNQTQVYYVGFSMGTSMFWIMCATRPEMCSGDKIKLMTALAPVVYINNMAGFPRLIAPLESIVFVSGYCDYVECTTNCYNEII